MQAGDLDTGRGREVFIDMLGSGQMAAEVIAARGFTRVDESGVNCDPQAKSSRRIQKSSADVKGGKQQAVGNLVGQVKKRNANVNPGRVREICLDLIAKL